LKEIATGAMMRKRFGIVIALVTVGLIGLGSLALGMGRQPPAIEKVEGRVTSVDLKDPRRPKATVRTDRGTSIVLQMDAKRTDVRQGGATLVPSSLRAGDWIRAEAEVRKGKYLARSVRVELPLPTKPAPKKPAGTPKKR